MRKFRDGRALILEGMDDNIRLLENNKTKILCFPELNKGKLDAIKPMIRLIEKASPTEIMLSLEHDKTNVEREIDCAQTESAKQYYQGKLDIIDNAIADMYELTEEYETLNTKKDK